MTVLINQSNSGYPTDINSGLNFILSHFKQYERFPRTISTKATEGRQKIVFSISQALAEFEESNLLDCRIAAFRSVNWRPKLSKLISPDFLFMDLDLGTLKTEQALEASLVYTLTNIKERLCGFPTVIWSGNGYHIYQPVESLILEEQDVFSKFNQPSRRLLQYAERYLTGGKMDACHNETMSFHNCMLRVPGSYNSKSDPPKPIKIIQRWDGKRPDIKPLLAGSYIYMQDLRLKEILKQQYKERFGYNYNYYNNNDCWHSSSSNNSKFCHYRNWRRR